MRLFVVIVPLTANESVDGAAPSRAPARCFRFKEAEGLQPHEVGCPAVVWILVGPFDLFSALPSHVSLPVEPVLRVPKHLKS